MKSLFSRGYRGLSDTIFSGVRGSVYRSVGIDHRSEPGKLMAHQKLTKDSGETIDELCKVGVNLSDNSKLWFSSESGKIWRENSGTYTLVHTGSGPTVGADEFNNVIYWATENYMNRFVISPYSLKDTSYDSSSFNASTQITVDPGSIIFKPDGMRMYIQHDDSVLQYDLATAFDLSTATYDDAYDAGFTIQNGFAISPNGEVLYVMLSDSIHAVGLSTAWDVTTGPILSSGRSLSETTTPQGMHLDKTGKHLFITDTDADKVFHYTFANANATDTAPNYLSYVNGGDFDTGAVSAEDIALSEDGKRMFLVDSNKVYEYRLATAFDVASASFFEEYTSTEAVDIRGICFNTAGDKMYLTDEDTEFVYQYTVKNDVTDWTNAEDDWTQFSKGSEHHPMVQQNLSLFIGDKNVIAEIDSTGTLVLQTFFNLPDNEIIKALTPFDIDLLIGTQTQRYGRVLRWDGLSESWSAEDDVYEKEGVTAFIVDDNFVYPVAGQKGSIYYYNGAKCEDFTTIPEITGQNTIKVNPNAVGFYQGVPVFGVSNVSGNPVLQGVYGIGSYNASYPRSLSLDYPMPSGEFSGVEIGAIIIDGDDMYVSWSDGVDTGVGKVDWTAKYASAYMETIGLTPAMNRHQIKTITEVMVPYYSLSTGTNITIGVDPDYTGSFSNKTVQTDTKRKILKVQSPSVPDAANPRLRIGFTVNGNNSPEIEDVLFDIAPIANR